MAAPPSLITFGREQIAAHALTAEWLVTNGCGGFASGSISGAPTRRYHGLLIAAQKAPLGRVVLVSRADETLIYNNQRYELGGTVTADGTAPPGVRWLERFCLDGTLPIWYYACGDALLEKRVWMMRDQHTTCIRYRLLRGTLPAALTVRVALNNRDFHENTAAAAFTVTSSRVTHGLHLSLGKSSTAPAAALSLLSDRAAAHPLETAAWTEPYPLPVETERGLPDQETDRPAAQFSAALKTGDAVTIWLTTDPIAAFDGTAALRQRQDYEADLIAASPLTDAPPWIHQLTLAADQFIVRRPIADSGDGLSILAGFPWFSDWGRDTMIALPGLTLATGRPRDAARILRTFARFVDQGMLPNRFPDTADRPEYNTVDATLWYFEAIRAYYAATGDAALVRDLYPVLVSIIDWHERGTRYGIKVDPVDGLLRAGEPGVQLTWMDVKIADWVVTSRTGKAVEINALWHNALCTLEQFAGLLGRAADAERFKRLSDRARHNFVRFWRDDAGLCYDVIDPPDGQPDASLRPNQVIAAALHYSPLTPAQAGQIVTGCGRALLTSYGLRSLAPDDPAYHGIFTGDQPTRDAAYHRGTVWGWLIGPFASAHYRAFNDAAAARALLEPFAQHLTAAGLGQISEVFEGDAPHAPKGCFAQAWSVGEVLRVWQQTSAAALTER